MKCHVVAFKKHGAAFWQIENFSDDDLGNTKHEFLIYRILETYYDAT